MLDMISLTSDLPFWIFLLLLLYRYLRVFVNEYAFLTHRNVPLPEKPTLTSRDVTVVIPCLPGEGIEDTLRSVLATSPAKIILVTIHAHLERARMMVKSMEVSSDILVMSVPQANKRKQMMHALSQIQTTVTIFADDDVTWPTTLLPWMLAPLEIEEYGGVGTNQWLRDAQNPSVAERVWRFLNVLYLQRRNFDCSACNHLDGGIPCLSGRTVAYRTRMLKDEAFIAGFENEVWRFYLWGFKQEYRLAVDDDNFITRWVYSHGHKIAFQYHKEAEVLTELETNAKYLKQCLRWSRSNWRSNITSMFVEGNVWRQHPWSLYAVFWTTLTHWAPLWDIGLWYLRPTGYFTFWLLLSVMAFSKVIKLVPLFLRNPTYILFLPVSIVFGQFHAFIKFYAACTLHVTAWGSRDGADDHDEFRMREIKQPDGLKTLPISKNEFMFDSTTKSHHEYHHHHHLQFSAAKSKLSTKIQPRIESNSYIPIHYTTQYTAVT